MERIRTDIASRLFDIERAYDRMANGYKWIYEGTNKLTCRQLKNDLQNFVEMRRSELIMLELFQHMDYFAAVRKSIMQMPGSNMGFTKGILYTHVAKLQYVQPEFKLPKNG